MWRLIVTITLSAACTLCAAAPAFALHRASPATVRAIHAAVLPPGSPYASCGRIAWARVSGRYAMAAVDARRNPHSCADQVQPATFMLKRHKGRWGAPLDVYNQFCPSIPLAVLADFRPYLVRRGLIHSGTALSSDCIGRIARS